MEFDVELVTDKMLTKVKVYTENEDFDVEKIRKASSLAAEIAFWVIAVVAFAEMLRLKQKETYAEIE